MTMMNDQEKAMVALRRMVMEAGSNLTRTAGGTDIENWPADVFEQVASAMLLASAAWGKWKDGLYEEVIQAIETGSACPDLNCQDLVGTAIEDLVLDVASRLKTTIASVEDLSGWPEGMLDGAGRAMAVAEEARQLWLDGRYREATQTITPTIEELKLE